MSNVYALELNDVSDKTILFSERPERIVTSIKTTDFIGNWTAGSDSFEEDPSNAVLIVDDEDGQEMSVFELFNPVFDLDANTLNYDIVLENATSTTLPNQFGQSTLVLNPIRNQGPWTGT